MDMSVANAVVWALTAVVVVCCVLRLCGRLIVNHIAGLDDFVVACATLHHVATTILFSVAVSYGTGKHAWEIGRDELPEAIRWNLIDTGMAIMDITLPKLSVAILLTRLMFPTRAVSCLLLGASLLLIVCGMITVLLTFCQCQPVHGQWSDPERAYTTCWTPSINLNFSIFTACYAAALDFAFALYPACVLAKLQLPWTKKMSVSMIMGLGAVAGAVAVYKVTLLPSLLLRGDLTATTADLTMWTLIEASVCLVAACAPTLGVYRFVRRTPAERRLLGSGGHARWPTADDLPDFKELVGQPGVDLGLMFVTKHVQVTTFREQRCAAAAAAAAAGGRRAGVGLGVGIDARWQVPPPPRTQSREDLV